VQHLGLSLRARAIGPADMDSMQMLLDKEWSSDELSKKSRSGSSPSLLPALSKSKSTSSISPKSPPQADEGGGGLLDAILRRNQGSTSMRSPLAPASILKVPDAAPGNPMDLRSMVQSLVDPEVQARASVLFDYKT
jgi:hypothetical protein